MLANGMNQADILLRLEEHIKALNQHPTVLEEEKADGIRQLTEWADTQLGDLRNYLKPNAL